MNESHVTHILEASPFRNLTAEELKSISAHVETCPACQQSYDAARISQLLLAEQVNEAAARALDLNPFFQTRVLAAWREQQALNTVSGFRRLWNSTSALVSSMAVTTAALAVLSFVVPSAERATQPQLALIPNSAEAVVLDQTDNDNQITDDQVFSTIYAADDEVK